MGANGGRARGVSAVVATILLIAITIVMVGSIAVFAGGFTGVLTSSTVNANVTIQGAYDGASSFTVRHIGGDDILGAFQGRDWNNIEVRINGRKVYVPALDLNGRDVTGGENFRPGDIMEVRPVFSGGSGTSDDPHIITSVENLQKIGSVVDDFHANVHYALGKNIGASATRYWNDNGTGGYFGFAPVCPTPNVFTGTFNGRGFAIRNLYINRPSSDIVGLFSFVDGGRLENVGMENVDITGRASVGGLVGRENSNSVIKNCYSTGTIRGAAGTGPGFANYGGLIGIMYGDISRRPVVANSYSSCTGNGNSRVGGIVGYCYYSNVENCYATGNISGTGAVGGLVGLTSNSSISRSFSTGSVTSGGASIGGLVGTITSSSTVTDSYSRGNVNGSSFVGGLAGQLNNSSSNNSYSTGSVSGGGSTGGLIGASLASSVNSSYYDMETSGQSDVGKGVPKTTAEMKQQVTYSGWDFTNTWGITEGVDYPHIKIPTGPVNADASRPKLKSGDVITVVYVPTNQVLASWTVS